MKVKIGILIVFFIASSCKEEAIFTANEFTVVIEDTADMSCYLPVIRFLDNTEALKSRTKMETETYNAYQLADSLSIIGNRLTIEFIIPQDEDMPVCNTYGIRFPGVLITKAKLSE